jgi:hypothetical protein
MGNGKRALVETMMKDYKTLLGIRLRSRDPAAQQTEAATGVALVNRMLVAERPHPYAAKPPQRIHIKERSALFSASMQKRHLDTIPKPHNHPPL